MVELINEEFSDEALKKEVEDRLMPRTEELPLYTTHEFNAKVMAGTGAVDARFSSANVPISFFSRPRCRSSSCTCTYMSLNVSLCLSCRMLPPNSGFPAFSGFTTYLSRRNAVIIIRHGRRVLPKVAFAVSSCA